jgi:hypothetical protein
MDNSSRRMYILALLIEKTEPSAIMAVYRSHRHTLTRHLLQPCITKSANDLVNNGKDNLHPSMFSLTADFT